MDNSHHALLVALHTWHPSVTEFLLFLLALILTVPLFFVRKHRARNISLYAVVLFLLSGILLATINQFSNYFSYFEASRFAKFFIYELYGLHSLATPIIIVLIPLVTGSIISSRKLRKLNNPQTRTKKQHLPDRYSKLMKMPISPWRLMGVVAASLLGIATLAYARSMVVEKYRYGKAVDLPEMSYGKLISYNCENYILTIGPNGELSNRKKEIFLAEMEYELVELIKDNPRGKHDLMDAEGQVTHDEYVRDIIIHLRVDEHCTYRDMQPVLRVLERRKIRWAWFRVAEE